MDYSTGGKSGLVNLGNTCFMNTCLQCLFHNMKFNTFISKGSFDNTKQKLLFQTQKLLNGLWENNCTVSPVSYHKTIRHIAKQEKVNSNFSGYLQNDINEFLVFIFEIMEKEHKDFFQKEFYGSLLTSIYDTDKDKTKLSDTKNKINMLHLPIFENCNLYDCIEKYQDTEKLEGENQWYNEKTKTHQDAIKHTRIISFPNQLIISLNRFNNIGRKLNYLIYFPETLNLPNGNYTLTAIGNHSGDLSGGHYYAYCLHGSHWYIYNDSGVQKIDKEKLVSKNAYILFYTKTK